MAKGGSKLVTGIVAFILGFLFAIIVEVGVIVGVGYYVLNTDINNLFGLFGLDNSDDQDRQYINTDTENGGVANVMALYTTIVDMAGRIGEVSIGELETLFPAFSGLTDSLYSSLSAYVEIDEATLESQAFMDLPVYLQDVIMEIQPGSIMRQAGMSDMLDSNVIVGALLEGVEAKYVYVNPTDKANSAKYPVYYDEYTETVVGTLKTYNRTEPGSDGLDAYPSNLNPGWLTDTGSTNSDGKKIFRQYYYKVAQSGGYVYVVTKLGSDGEYGYSPSINSSNTYYAAYGENYQYLTGHYYYDGETRVMVTPVTIRTLSEDAMAPLDLLTVTDAIGGDELMQEIFGDTSLGDLIAGNVNVSELVDALSLASVIDIKIDDPVLLYMGYKVTGAVDNGNGTFSATYAAGTAEERPVTVYVNAGIVDKVVDSVTGDEIAGVTVSEVGDVISDVTSALTIGDMMDIEPENMIMSYLAYGISNVTKVIGEGYSYTASYEKQDGSVGTAYVYTKIKNGKTVIDYVTMDAPDGDRLACTTVDGISDMVDGIKITSIMQVEADNAIMSYLAYGLTDMVKVDDATYTGKVSGEDVTVKVDSEGNILSVVKGDGTYVSGTSIDDISTRLDNITADLALADVMTIEPSAFDSEGNITENNNIMTFLAFSVSDVSYSAGEYSGVYNVYGSDGTWLAGYPCKLIIEGDGISYVIYDSDDDGVYESVGVKTKIDGVSDQISRLTDTMRIKDIIEIDKDNKLMVKLGEYKLNEVGDAIDDFELADAIDIDATDPLMLYIGYGITELEAEAGTGYTHKGNYVCIEEDGSETVYECFVTIDGTTLTDAYYVNGSDEHIEIKGTTLNTVDSRINTLTDHLTVGDVIDPGEDELLLALAGYKLNDLSSAVNDLGLDIFIKDIEPDDAILMYITYGVSSVHSVTGEIYSYEGVVKDEGGSIPVYITTEINGAGKEVVTGVYTDAACTTKVEATTVDGVSDRISGLTSTLKLSEIIDIDPGNKVLNLVKDSTIDNLDETVRQISLQRMYTEDIYGGTTVYKVGVGGNITFDPAYVYYTDEECTTLAGDNGKIISEPVDTTYYTYGAATGIWKMLLKDSLGSEKVYTLNNIDDMVGTATNNIKNGTLGDLNDAGIVVISQADLEKSFAGHKLRDLILSDLISLVISMSS
ncbi:MAG: hypothetical protein ACI4MH_05015 [Candidatus Coproplasma sp.]